MSLNSHFLCNLSVRIVVKLCTVGVFCFRGEIGFQNCDDICMCVVTKQFVFVYVDLQYDDISLNFTARSVWYL